MEKLKSIIEFREILSSNKYFTIEEVGTTTTTWCGQSLVDKVIPVHSRLRSKLSSDYHQLEYLLSPKRILIFGSLKQAMDYIEHNLSDLVLSEDPYEDELSKVQALMIAIATTNTNLMFDAKLMRKYSDLKNSIKHPDIHQYYQEWLKTSRGFRQTCNNIMLEIKEFTKQKFILTY